MHCTVAAATCWYLCCTLGKTREFSTTSNTHTSYPKAGFLKDRVQLVSLHYIAEHNIYLIRNTPLARLGGTQGHKMRSV